VETSLKGKGKDSSSDHIIEKIIIVKQRNLLILKRHDIVAGHFGVKGRIGDIKNHSFSLPCESLA